MVKVRYPVTVVRNLRTKGNKARRAAIGAAVLLAGPVWLTACGGERSGQDAAQGGDEDGNSAAVGNTFGGSVSAAGGLGAGSGGTDAISGGGTTLDAGDGGTVASVAGAGGCSDALPEPEAGRILTGDLFIESASDAEAAQDVSEITGSLEVLTSYEGVLSLPNLTAVRGAVRVSGGTSPDGQSVIWPRITELRLPNLTTIGDELFVYLTDALVETDLRSLDTVGARIYYMRNLALRRLGLDAVRDASVQIQACPIAAACEIEAICAQVGGANCGAEYSDPNCTCAARCGRVEPNCP